MIYSSTVHGHSARSSKEQEYLQGWQRSRAEFLNFRQRIKNETQQAGLTMQRRLLEPLVQVADSFQAIAHHIPDELQKNTWAQGVLHVTRQFEQLLAEYQLVPFGEVSEHFDPHLHEAVDQVEEAGQPSGTIAAIIQPGYRLGEIVIRPARVKVYV